MFSKPEKQSFFSNGEKKSNLIEYFINTYPESHWAKHAPTIGDKNFIATLEINGKKIGLKLNSTDSRGYRAIVGLVHEDMSSTFNRNYTLEEKLALNTALCILSTAYENHGMIAQTEIAGNNSQSINENGVIQMGNEKEPSLLHGHIIGRGNPLTCYIGNVPLRGPKAGAMFNMRGDGNEEGNKSKTKWEEKEIETVADALAVEVSNVLKSSPLFKDVNVISIRAENSSSLKSKI